MHISMLGHFIMLFMIASLPFNFLKPRIVFQPDSLNKLERGITKRVYWYLAETSKFFRSGISFHVSYYFNSKIVEISGHRITSCLKAGSGNYSFELKAKSSGFTEILLILKPTNCSTFELLDFEYIYTYHVSVITVESVWARVFKIALVSIITLNYVNIGCQLDITEIIKVLKQPAGPIIGVFSKFLMMPLMSLGIGYLLLNDWHLRLGLFALGCSPGGNMNVVWSHLLNGDINLSITMMFINRVAALGLTSLWFFILGRELFYEGQFVFSYFKLLVSLVSLICPLGIGLLIRQFKPNLALVILKLIRPILIIMIMIAIVILLSIHQYLFLQITWKVIISCFCLFSFGFLFSFSVAWLFRLEKPQILVIVVETSFQNGGMAFLMLKLSLIHSDTELTEIPVVAQLTLNM
ncbi:sodium/bile acid cotransporter-like [Centruroides sculpturatus]|uniref:sodium/bile acid cotransporter-like n=1 Tax=Centruroides sculpturatus TaxID=218467 RepID=UPI000C6D56FC|nr:sodium/bile acid cotransporter-like [Centruroides sculpturatus]